MKGIIMILGSPNDDKGDLLNIAKERLSKGLEEFRKHQNYKILLTGGFGEHFNRTKKPHAYYAKKFLLRNGVDEKNILKFAESNDTIEDAALSKPIVDKYGVKNLIIVTSDFHVERVKYIFRKIFKDYNLVFPISKTEVSDEEMKKLLEHEKRHLAALEKDNL